MGDFIITLRGVPPGLNEFKLRLQLEKKVAKGLISGVERQDDGSIILKFIRQQDVVEFRNKNIREIEFGNESHLVTIEDSSEDIRRKQSFIQGTSNRPGQSQNLSSRGSEPAISRHVDDEQWRRKLYVTNIPRHLDSRQALKYHFERFGRVERCYVKPGRFAYVEFSNHFDAAAALLGARSAGPNFYLNILWDRRETPMETRPPPLMSIPTGRPQTGFGGRRSASAMDLRQEERPQTSHSKQQALLRSLEQKAEHLYNHVHYWSTFEELPAEEGTLCVLVDNIEDSASLQSVIMHFESKKRSSGGLVKSVIKMVDGLLIVFQDEADCQNCLGMKEQTFSGTKLHIFAKRVPSYFERKFVVKGIDSKTSRDTLMMLLEKCSPHETSPISCEKLALPGVRLIQYGDDIDPSEISEIMKNVDGEKLDKSALKVSKLLRTDCLKVKGIEDDVTSDTIRLTFESKKRTDGGPVTRVEHLKDKTILVYFAEFTDAERVYTKFNKKSDETMVISGFEVEIELYFHSLANDHKTTVKQQKPKKSESEEAVPGTSGPKPTLKSYDFQPGCKEKLLHLIQNNQTHMDRLLALCTDFATVQFSLEKKGKRPPFIKFSPTEKTNSENQKAFNAECKKRFEEFTSTFSTESPMFDKAKLEKARSAELLPLIDKNYQGDGVDIIVSWKDTSAEVIGVDEVVKKFIADINSALEFTVQKMPLSDIQYKILNACEIVNELRKNHPSVSIECEDKTSGISLTGTSDEINNVKIAALTILNTIEKKKLASINTHILTYLLEMKDSAVVKTEIEKKFKADGAKALLSIDDEDVYLRVQSGADFKRASNALIQLIKIETIKIDEATSVVVKSPLWKGFIQSLRGVDPCTVYVKHGEEIKAVGLQFHVQAFCIKINDFLDENATRHFLLKMPYGSAKFIVEKSKEFSAEACKRLGIRCQLTAEKGGGICIEGKRKTLEKVRPQLVQHMQGISEIPHTITKPGITQYYQGEDGKRFLKLTENANNCIILERKSNPTWEKEKQRMTVASEEASQRSTKPKEQCLVSVTLPNSGVSLQVWKANIIEHKCDAIINASNPELQLLPSGVSGVIKKLDSQNRNRIQAAMTRHIEENHGSYLSGDAVITTSGNLPNCRKIVHAVGPKWHSSTEREPGKALKASIFNSLKEASQAGMTSIAVPAISCGVFSGKIDVCIPLILEAATEYFKEETQTTIKRVDFIEIQSPQVLAEFTKAVRSYGVQSNIPNVPQQNPPQPNPRRQNLIYMPRQSSLNIQLKQGDLTASQDDVIVNITSPKGFPGMNGSAISKSLLKAGGSGIAQECASNPGPHRLGAVVVTSGGSLACRQIYHGIAAHYGQNSEQIIRQIVSNCLRTADNSGYNSIAFPAIATGGFKHPAKEVAKWMNAEISKFVPQNLTNVTIVLWINDTSTISDFQAEFSGMSTSSFQGTSSQSSSQSGGNFGGINVNVYQGDITQETSDVIVNSTNSNFDLSQGMVAQAITSLGGPGIQTELQSASGSDCRITSGGNLQCSWIVHVATPDNDKDIIKKVEQVLYAADQQGANSISFPALATGNIGLDSSMVAHAMRKAFEKFAKSQNNVNIMTINVVIFDQKLLGDFKKRILTPEQSILGKMRDSISSWFGMKSASSEKKEEERYTLFIYSNDIAAINKATAAIDQETMKNAISRVIRDDALGRLSEWELWELKQVERTNNVKISDIPDMYFKQIAVQGLRDAVSKAHDRIKDILKDFCESETTATYVTWQKLVNGKWEDYHPRTATTLEKAYKVRNGNKTDARLNKISIVEFGNGKMNSTTVDLSNLEGDRNGPNPPGIRRKVNEKGSDDDIPSFWDPMQGQRFLKVVLQPGSSEYQEAFNAYQNTRGSGTITKIERIQNESLYKQYIAKKAEVAKKITSGNPVERQLFHGTADDDKIVLQGFDRSFAGKNATALGVGVYFALEASYSNSYASPDGQGLRRMFLADVITGDYCQGDRSIRAAPLKPGSTQNDTYDSVVNSVNSPSIFVIFKDASAYPKFLITYR